MTIEELNAMTDQQLLDYKIGGQVARDMTAITFLSIVAEKISGAPTYSAETQEVLSAVRGAPIGRVMADKEKVRLMRKLLVLNIML